MPGLLVDKSIPLLGALLLIIIGLSWFSVKMLQDQIRTDLQNSLLVAVETTQEAMRSWAVDRIEEAELLAARPDFVALVSELLGAEASREQLAHNKALKQLRKIIGPWLIRKEDQGMFIISLKGINYGSMRDSNLGVKNLITEVGDYFQKLSQGIPQLILPIRSDVLLPDLKGRLARKEPTMFVGVPVRGNDGAVIAIFTIRINPSRDFTRIVQIARFGVTGDSYAFDKSGRLITECRFDDQLREVGLLNEAERSILNLTLRDPGGNMVNGFRPTKNRAALPLTRMAKMATSGLSGLDLDGYRDYRGVPVVGAWIWEDKYQYGLTFEIDVAEAYETYYVIRGLIIFLLASITALFILYALFTLRSKRKTEKINRQLEELIREREKSEKRFRTLMESSPDGMLLVDRTGAIRLSNRQIEILFGWKNQDLIGQPVEKLIPERYQSHPRLRESYFEIAGANPMEIDLDLFGLRADGTEFPVEVGLSVVEVGEGRAVIATVRDITIRKESEDAIRNAKEKAEETANQLRSFTRRLEAKNRELDLARMEAESATRTKSEFLANMSHEIRTPLNAVIGFSELLGNLVVDDAQKSYLDSIQAAGKSLLTLINDILDLSKLEAGKMVLNVASVNLANLLDEIRQIFILKISEKNLVMDLELDPQLPEALLLDEIRVRQVLLNLVGNAVKFTDTGGVTISVSPRNLYLEARRTDLVIEVSDTGVGIPPEQQQSIFESFKQQEGQSSRKYGGTGLGLTISSRLVEIMNGTIAVRSAKNEGSVFRIELNDVVIAEHQPEAADDALIDRLKDFRFEKSLVLIADDVASNRFVAREMLKRFGVDIVEAEDGRQALQVIADRKPDLVLMDLRMPVMDGFTATEKLKSDPETGAIPILALTASIRPQDQQNVMESGFDGLLLKPIDSMTLVNELSRFLRTDIKRPESGITVNEADSGQAVPNLPTDLPGLIRKLETEYLKNWQELQGAMDMEALQTFAASLLELAGEHSAASLQLYGSRLMSYIDTFEIEKIEPHLSAFQNEIEILKKHL